MTRLQKLVDWVKDAREILDELSVVVQQPEEGAKFLNILWFWSLCDNINFTWKSLDSLFADLMTKIFYRLGQKDTFLLLQSQPVFTGCDIPKTDGHHPTLFLKF